MKSMMKAAIIVGLAVVGSLGAAQAAISNNAAADKMDDATSVLQQFVNIPENSVPQALLRSAYGIAVIPSVFKISFLGGVQHGTGVLSVRTSDGKWSDPTFISLTGGSVGFQAGVSSTDIILVFKTQRSVDRIANGQITLGGDASVAAGPVGRSAGAATNLDFNAEVYSYSRSRGLFGGVSLGGSRIGIDQDDNWLFYNQVGVTARQLLSQNSIQLPTAGQRFIYTLNQYMPPSNDKFNYGASTGADAGQNNGQGNSQMNGQLNGQNGNGYQNGMSGDANGQTQPYKSTNSGAISVQPNGGANNPATANGQGKTSDYSGDSSNYGGTYNGGANSKPQSPTSPGND